jgi:hypothetical protein
MGSGQLSKAGAQVFFFGTGDRGGPALGGTGLTDGPTRTTL